MKKYELTRRELMALSLAATGEMCKEQKFDNEEKELIADITSDVTSKIIAHLDGIEPLNEDELARARTFTAATDSMLDAIKTIAGDKQMEDTRVLISEERYKELIEKEVRLEILEKELKKDRNALLDVNELSDILGIAILEKDEK